MSEEEKGLTAAEQVKKNISLLLNVSKLGQRHGGLRKRFISGRRGSSLGRPKVWSDDGGTERKDKESIHGRNNRSGITQGRTDEIISGDGNAENASPKKKRGISGMKMKQNNISKLVTAAKVLKDAILLRVNLESFS